MKRKLLKKIPIGVLFISSFYVFGAFMLMIGVFTNSSAVRETIARAHGLLPSVDVALVLSVNIFSSLDPETIAHNLTVRETIAWFVPNSTRGTIR